MVQNKILREVYILWAHLPKSTLSSSTYKKCLNYFLELFYIQDKHIVLRNRIVDVIIIKKKKSSSKLSWTFEVFTGDSPTSGVIFIDHMVSYHRIGTVCWVETCAKKKWSIDVFAAIYRHWNHTLNWDFGHYQILWW